MKRALRIGIVVAILAAVVAGAWYLQPPQPGPAVTSMPATRSAKISPDYRGVILPPNIAPLNFVIREDGTAYHVTIRGQAGEIVEISSRRPTIEIPLASWQQLLAANAGGEIRYEITVRDRDGRWLRYASFKNTVAREPIDAYLLYRRLDPVYRCWGDISIRQRNLTSFDESCVVWNRSSQYDCLNCHSVCRQQPDRFAVQVRSETIGARMLLARDTGVSKVSTSTDFNRSASSYYAWHPNGRTIAFAAIKVTQFFHALGETRDVFDEASDLALYDTETNTVTTTAEIAKPDRLETYPAWTPDGRTLYFCSAPQLPKMQYKEVQYDLMRIAYDPATGAWGRSEVVYAAKEQHRSVTHPRISPDGRFLLFCECNYGNFSIYHPESDLVMLDLGTGQRRRLAINSNRSDSYHSWSGNSRWIVFSSKRRDGLLTHPYISYVDETGEAHKPLILPQQDPTFYDTCLQVFNVPEFAPQRVDGYSRALTEAMNQPSDMTNAKLDPGVTIQHAVPNTEMPWKSAR